MEEMARKHASGDLAGSRAPDDASMQEIKLALLKISSAQETLSQNFAQLSRTVADLSKGVAPGPGARSGGAAPNLGPDASPSDWANHQVVVERCLSREPVRQQAAVECAARFIEAALTCAGRCACSMTSDDIDSPDNAN